MLTVTFDEGHSESWTTDLESAFQLSPLQPDYHYFGHLSALLESSGATVNRFAGSWSRATIQNRDVIVFAHPADSSEEKGCSGTPIFSPEEITALVDFVTAGGALLVMGEWEIERWKSNINDLLVQFGLAFRNDTLMARRGDPANSHLLAKHFSCSTVSDHLITRNTKRITYHRGCSISTIDGLSTAIISAPSGQAVLAVAEHGAGRVAAIGDSDLFSIPFIGHGDNAQLFIDLVSWLGGQQLRATEVKSIVQRSYNLRPVSHHRDAGLIAGEHLIDCTSFTGLNALCENLLHNPYEDPEAFLVEAELKSHELPAEIRRRLIDFRRNGNEHGVLLVKGLPADPFVPATPRDSKRSFSKQSFVSEFWLSLFSTAVGDPFNYFQEKGGELFQNLCPTPGNAEKLSSESSLTLLDFHTETAFHPYMPDFVVLYCVRPDHEKVAQTIYASMRHMIPLIPLKYRALLFEDAFQTGIDYSFGSQSGLQGNGPVLPVLYGSPYSPYMKFDLDLMVGKTPEAATALEEMRRAANEAKNWVRLDSGDLLIIDNLRAVHGRSQFVPRYDGMDRWLQRMYVLRDLVSAEAERRRGERIIETEFQV